MKNTIIVDVDGTLCELKSPEQSYSDAKPIWKVVEKLREMKDSGFYIVLHTARNMRTYEGNLGKINKYTAPILHDWLTFWNIPYDEIYFGKIWPGQGGFYIDDRTVRPSEFLTLEPDSLAELVKKEAKIDQVTTNHRRNIVITMAGAGKRFYDAGYKLPKYKLKVKGKTLFLWSLLSLKAFLDRDAACIFVARKEDQASDFIYKELKEFGKLNIHILEIDHLTDGQATSAKLAQKYWNPCEPILIYNIDTYVEPNIMTPQQIQGSGWLPCFKAKGEHWSFAKLGKGNKVINVQEKERISPYATLGLYWFSSAKLYSRLYETVFSDSKGIEKGEKYIAPMYNKMIEMGMTVKIQNISPDKVVPLGTPAEVENFAESK